jgi:4'-phosphopantetheinyl transferase
MSEEGAIWRAAEPHPRLTADEVHLWRTTLDRGPDDIAAGAMLLAEDERVRAARFLRAEDRDHFIICRAVLRRLIGRYLGRDAASLRFRYGAQGKPALASESMQLDLRFNLSHSHGWALYGFALAREVGVDLEYRHRDLDWEPLAARFFAEAETAQLCALAPALRAEAFFRCWSRKEAFLKACGEGLSIGLDAFAVSVAPDLPAALMAMQSDPLAPLRWRLHDVPMGGDYAAALAVDGMAPTALSLFEWPSSRNLLAP